MLAFSSRLTCQQSSMFTYMYPASFIPDLTTASAIPLIMSSLTLHWNLFQEFQPIGGVSARFAEGEAPAWAEDGRTAMTHIKNMAEKNAFIFMANVVSEPLADWY